MRMKSRSCGNQIIIRPMMTKSNLTTVFAICLLAFSMSNCSTPKGDKNSKSTNYKDLVSLFWEFRKFQEPTITNGIPDYSPAIMKLQYSKLQTYQDSLKAIDPTAWSVSDQIDYHLVRAEMNGYEFQHRVMKPWARDPCFYLDQLPYFQHLSLDVDNVDALKARFQAIPELFHQAKSNLSNFAEVPDDLGILALKRIDDLKVPMNDVESKITELHPELVPDLKNAWEAIDDFNTWVELNQDKMKGVAGVGKENYNWLLKNVYLLPYTWDECKTIVELEDNRVITFLKLEENRNRKLPMLKHAASFKEYKDGIYDVVDHIMKFLKEEEILTVHDYLIPDDYYASRLEGKGYHEDQPWPKKHDYFFNFSHREPVMENTHELVHHFDGLRAQRDDRPIRGANHLYKISTDREEGFAFALEELFMHAGYLDDRPQRGREIAYEQAAFRTVRALADLNMHNGDWTLTGAMDYAVANAPQGEILDGSPHLWFEMETTLRGVGHHMIMVVGKVQFMELLRDRSQQLGDNFVLKEFMDEYLAAGMIPQSLIRWEITGLTDEIEELGAVN